MGEVGVGRLPDLGGPHRRAPARELPLVALRALWTGACIVFSTPRWFSPFRNLPQWCASQNDGPPRIPVRPTDATRNGSPARTRSWVLSVGPPNVIPPGRSGFPTGSVKHTRPAVRDWLAVCYAQSRQSETGRFATVAQLVEQRFRKPQVVGSSPTRGSTSKLPQSR